MLGPAEHFVKQGVDIREICHHLRLAAGSGDWDRGGEVIAQLNDKFLCYIIFFFSENFPPNVTMITDPNNVLQGNVLCVEVNETVQLMFTAEDPNANDIINFTLADSVPDGAAISSGKYKTNKFIVFQWP